MHKYIKILTDSQAALKALGSNRIDFKTVWNCLHSMNRMGANNSVTLLWLPDDSGEVRNEEADFLAKHQFIGPEPFFGIRKNLAKEAISMRANEQTILYWRDVTGLSHSKVFIKEPNRRTMKQLLEWSRPNLRMLTGLLTGHCRLNHHMQKIGLRRTSDCRFCNDDTEAAEHILCTCIALERARFQIFGETQLESKDIKDDALQLIITFTRRIGQYGEL